MRNPFRNVELNIAKHWKAKLATLGYFMAVFIYLELAIHFVIFKEADSRLIYPILFAAVSGAILYLVTSLFTQTVNRILGMVIISLTVIYFEVQLVYHFVFQTFMPVSQVFLGADAVTNYTNEIFRAIGGNIVGFLLVLLPLPLTLVLFLTKKIKTYRVKLLQIPVVIAIIAILTVGVMHILHANNTSPNSAYAILVDTNSPPQKSVKNLGLAVTTVQEIRGMLMGNTHKIVFFETDLDNLNNEGQLRNENEELDFIALSNMTSDERFKVIDLHLNGVSPTAKSEYTGIAEGYNVITICAEAFSPLVIDEEMTPTLYKLSNNGIVFNNFYNSFPNTTTNGEYALCMGLLPDLSRSKVSSSFSASIDNYLPYCLGNILTEEEYGYKAVAFHNYYGNFYSRDISHPNMGYEFYAVGTNGFNTTVGSPSSDLDMIKASLPYYIDSEEPFHAYYMTYSGHYEYSWKNEMSAKNRDKVEHLDYSEAVQAYLACNLELEYALTHLMEALEEAGKADNTMIVLTGDHYPYGLSIEEYSELAGHEVDESFEKYKSSFICYIPGIEPVEVDNYCSSVDILPTVLNLLGVKFDSRLLVGKDVLSDAYHVAVISNQSFITDTFSYNSDTFEVISHDGSVIDDLTVESYCNYVRNMFTLSSAILDTNYYSHVFGKESEMAGTGVKYSDIGSIYVDSAANFMVQQGYMLPETDDRFGASNTESYITVIDILYKMAGSPQVYNNTNYSDAIKWALDNNIIKDAGDLKKIITNGDLSYSIYQYVKYIGGDATLEISDEDYVRIQELRPELSHAEIVAMRFCIDLQIMHNMNDEDAYFKDYDAYTPKGQLAVYLQRMYFTCQVTD